MDTKLGTLVSGVKQIQPPREVASRDAHTGAQSNTKINASNQLVDVSGVQRTAGSAGNDRVGAANVEKLPSKDGASLDEVVAQLNKQVQQSSRALQFSIDDRQGKPVVLVVDKDTDQIIRQIPSEVALQLSDALEEATTSGTLVSEHA